MKHPNGTEPYQARTAADPTNGWPATPDVDSNTISAHESTVIAPFDLNNSHAARKHHEEIQTLLSKLKTAQADLRASETRLKSVEVENMQLKEGCVRLQAALKTSNEQLQDATQRLRVVTQDKARLEISYEELKQKASKEPTRVEEVIVSNIENKSGFTEIERFQQALQAQQANQLPQVEQAAIQPEQPAQEEQKSQQTLEEQQQEQQEQEAGRITGVGLTLEAPARGIFPVVSSVTVGGSAFASNKISKGDILVAVKDSSRASEFVQTSGKSIDQTCKLVLGPEGTDVTLKFRRAKTIASEGYVEFDCVLRRGNVASNNQESTPSPVTTFQDDLAETTDKLLQEAQIWAIKSKLSHIHKTELEMVVKLVEAKWIPLDEILNPEPIDSGTFSTIEKAIWRGRHVAVKRVSRDSFRTVNNQLEGSVAQVLRGVMLELDIVTMLEHPCVCQYYGTVAHFPPDGGDMQLGLVFALCAGNLHNALHPPSGKADLSLDLKMVIAADIAEGVTYLHSLNIIHRDLSSRNILLNNASRALIADFGCARRMTSESGYNSTTISGSPAYMPPEQLTGATLTLKSDVFAYGVLLWELLSEQVPHVDLMNNLDKIRARVTRGDRLLPISEGLLSKEHTFRYNALIRRATNSIPKARPSIGEMREALKALFDESWFEATWERGRSDLETSLRAFYQEYNPAKVVDAYAVSEEFFGNEAELNKKLVDRYKRGLRL